MTAVPLTAEPLTAEPLLAVRDLSVVYPVRGLGRRRAPEVVRAVDGVSLDVGYGETVGLVGESGSGKSTTGNAILRCVDIAGGSIHLMGRDITHLKGKALRRVRREMQMVFQDPYGSLNPRMRVRDIIAEPLVVFGEAKNAAAARDRVVELLELTGMPADAADRHPHSFSGGQRQRIGIARALALEPKFLVVDEPVAALDTSIQAQVVNLLQDLQERLGLGYLFIAHDLSVVRHISDRVAIIYAGRIVESGPRDDLYDAPAHPYTRALLSAVPVPDPRRQRERRRIVLTGEPPDQITRLSGCPFASRCPEHRPGRCDVEVPQLREVGPGHQVSCHWAEGPAVAGSILIPNNGDHENED